MSNLSINGAPLAQIYAFNLRPHTFIHESWYTPATVKAVHQLRRTSSNLASIDKYLLDKFRLRNNYCFDFSRPQLRLVLEGSDVLERFIRLSGLVHMGGLIRRSIKADDVIQIRNELANDEYEFAMNRAAFIVPDSRIEGVEGHLNGLSSKVDELGVRSLKALVISHSDAIVKRVELKLHKSLAPYFEIEPSVGDEDTAKLLAIKLLPFCEK